MIEFFLTREEGRLGQLVLRMSGAAVVSWLLVMLLMPRFIRLLVRKRIGDRPEFDHASLNDITRHKSNTPTMGGALIALAIFSGTVLFADLQSFYVRMGVICLAWLGLLGAVDDYFKIRKYIGDASRDGLRMWEKTVFQMGLGVLLAAFIWSEGARGGGYFDPNLGRSIHAVAYFYLPFKAVPLYLGQAGFIIVTILVMVGSSNAVNLTDGMDGLAAGCMIIVSGVFLLLAWVAGNQSWAEFLSLPFVPGAAEMAVLCAAMIGACLGFLWYNCNPAQIFMGDTGSLPLGGLIGYVAVVTRQEIMLGIAGGVFVMEAVSVLLQVGYFKATHGKRLFRIAPIHHHFHVGGWSEPKVVVRFWLLTAMLAAVALATLKLR